MRYLILLCRLKTEGTERKRWLVVLVSVYPEPDGNDTEKADENPILPFLIFCRVITEPDREVPPDGSVLIHDVYPPGIRHDSDNSQDDAGHNQAAGCYVQRYQIIQGSGYVPPDLFSECVN